LDHAKKVLD